MKKSNLEKQLLLEKFKVASLEMKVLHKIYGGTGDEGETTGETISPKSTIKCILETNAG